MKTVSSDKTKVLGQHLGLFQDHGLVLQLEKVFETETVDRLRRGRATRALEAVDVNRTLVLGHAYQVLMMASWTYALDDDHE